MKRILLGLAALVLAALPASALTYQYKDNQGNIFNIQVWSCGSSTCTNMVLSDTSGNAIGTASNPIRIDPVGATTQPVSIATFPLPTGAATSTLQPTNAGQGSVTSGQTGTLSMGAVTSAAPSYNSSQTNPISLDTAGNLRINCITGCSSSGGSSVTDESAFTQGTTALTVAGGIYVTSITNLTAGQAGAVRLTNDRKMMIDTPNIEVGGISSGGTAATFAAQVAGIYNSSTPLLTNGQGIALQVTSAGSLHSTIDNSITVANTYAPGQTFLADSQPVAPAQDWIKDPCWATVSKQTVAISQTASAQVIGGNAGTYTYVCAIFLMSGSTQTVSIVEGTGSVCASGTAAVVGGSTAAAGMPLAANVGFAPGAGIGTIFGAFHATTDNICILQSGSGGANSITGYITYVQ